MKKTFTIIAIVLTAVLLSGCLGAGNMRQVKNSLKNQLPESRIKTTFRMHVGPVLIGTTKLIARLIDDEDLNEARTYLSDIRQSRVNLYHVDGVDDLDKIKTPSALRKLTDRGWDMLVRVREEDSLVWVLSRERFGDVRDLYVVTMTTEELVMVRAKGNFSRLIRKAIRDNKDATGLFAHVSP